MPVALPASEGLIDEARMWMRRVPGVGDGTGRVTRLRMGLVGASSDDEDCLEI